MEPGSDEAPWGEWVSLMHPAPGWFRCCICFEARTIDQLLVDEETGIPWDICREGERCAEQAGFGPDGRPLTTEPGENH